MSGFGHFPRMSTLAEIECTLPTLTLEELCHLDKAVDTQLAIRSKPKVRTARDARDWWEGAETFSREETEAFANDVEAGRKLTNQTAIDRWA